ncbi:hypothetical protein HK096_003919 [Nowakowskiella sp. JEL0078]|nr:hypothetical protein HK096_003919 [Nowakowskiella sp. JEL0078]
MHILKQQLQHAQPLSTLALPATPQTSFSFRYQPCLQLQQHNINSIQPPTLSFSGPFITHNPENSGQKSPAKSTTTQLNLSQQSSFSFQNYSQQFSRSNEPTTAHLSTQASNHQKPENRISFVEGLVEISASVINSIWPNNSYSSKCKLLPIQSFIEEILRRSRTSFSTLQLALLYLLRLKQGLPAHILQLSKMDNLNNIDNQTKSEFPLLDSVVFPLSPLEPQRMEGEILADINPLQSSNLKCGKQSSLCGRRMFLSALVIAGKYLQDQAYSNRAWAKISGLAVEEVNQNEVEFLKIIDYRLHVNNDTFISWSQMLISWTNFNKLKKEMHFSQTKPRNHSSPHFESTGSAVSVNDIRSAEQSVKKQKMNSEPNGLLSPPDLLSCFQKFEKECKQFTQSSKNYLPSPSSEQINQPSIHSALKEHNIRNALSSLLGAIGAVTEKTDVTSANRKRKFDSSVNVCGLDSSTEKPKRLAVSPVDVSGWIAAVNAANSTTSQSKGLY